jgi:hypothetical protein
VALVTDAFVDELINAIINHGGFQLKGLGKLKVRFERGPNKAYENRNPEGTRIRLYFTKSRDLRRLIVRKYGLTKEPTMEKKSDEGMTKYAVDEGYDQDQLEKAAARGCPICAQPVVKHGRVVACPTHGTEPFER